MRSQFYLADTDYNKLIISLILIMKHIVIFIILFSWYSAEAQNIQKKLQTSFITVEEGGTISIPAGNFLFKKSLWLDGKNNITIIGAGMDKTILNFENQEEGAEGIKVTNATNILIEGLTVQNTKGDAIKTQDVEGITFKEVKAEWTGKPSKSNGAYGLYPVQCQKVLIDKCIAKGASDAGIYVGQSDQVIVRNSLAEYNVAGIEIENTTNAKVHDCIAQNNTGGILVFDLPGLQMQGATTQIFNNKILNNNYKNFAPKGNVVAFVPAGTGVLILAAENVEVFNNEIIENKSFGAAIASYYVTEKPIKDKNYNPYPRAIYFHNNVYKRSKKIPTLKNPIGILAFIKFGRKVPDIVYDGFINPDFLDKNGKVLEAFQICLKEDASFANLDIENGFKNISKDIKAHDCSKEVKPQINLVTKEK